MTRRILVLGASGMLGNAVFRYFARSVGYDVIGAVRSSRLAPQLDIPGTRILAGFDAENADSLAKVIDEARPDVVVNCVGLVKQLAESEAVLAAVPINTLLPHRLVQLTALASARLVHISTDCVFRGDRSSYVEADRPDATDVYGLSKFLGEIDAPHAITLRTSIIGHEMGSQKGLIGWFLAQQGSARGFTRAIFSGLPTVELARVIRDYVLPHPGLHGLYHVSSAPIAKYDLLRAVADAYGKDIDIVPDDKLVIDRSLNSTRFSDASGYVAPDWAELIKSMHNFG